MVAGRGIEPRCFFNTSWPECRFKDFYVLKITAEKRRHYHEGRHNKNHPGPAKCRACILPAERDFTSIRIQVYKALSSSMSNILRFMSIRQTSNAASYISVHFLTSSCSLAAERINHPGGRKKGRPSVYALENTGDECICNLISKSILGNQEISDYREYSSVRIGLSVNDPSLRSSLSKNWRGLPSRKRERTASTFFY
jgi:hypothetical protein